MVIQGNAIGTLSSNPRYFMQMLLGKALINLFILSLSLSPHSMGKCLDRLGFLVIVKQPV